MPKACVVPCCRQHADVRYLRYPDHGNATVQHTDSAWDEPSYLPEPSAQAVNSKFESANLLFIVIPNMNEEQTVVFDAVVAGISVLLTSRGGCGKSYTLSNIIDYTTTRDIPIGVTATTGCAALLIKGTTIHSFLGIGLATKPVEQLARECMRKQVLYNRLNAMRLLIIDEISMMSDTLFDVISSYLSLVRKNNSPFGGVQVILCGDLYQIPPVKDRFFFNSDIWTKLSASSTFKMFELKLSQRHISDKTFDILLQKLRTGKCDNETLAVLRSTETNTFPNGIKPTILYLKNVDVDLINSRELAKLEAAGAVTHTYVKQTSENAGGKAWAQSCKVPDNVSLCEGAQVMLTWNTDIKERLCNGSRGVVVSLNPEGVYVDFVHTSRFISFIVVEHPDSHDVWIKYMPLRLAYALTVNKSQSMTLDAVVVDMDVGPVSADFLYGKFYTAVSRVRSLSDIVVKNASKRLFLAHPEVLKMDTLHEI